ncbi:MAG: Holliday junction branch migration protein RuvA [Deltaproteobacteria bacterium]|nr:Holliday junction branch migration protein RuvA [Deltaproteobacteria bacterium]
MIASLSGVIERATPGDVVLGVGGVGYRVRVPLSTYASLPGPGEQARLRIVTIVREDEISLYGFSSPEEEDLFGLMQGVSGVGPKLSLKILSGLTASALRQALSRGDLRVLTSIPGVGAKLAQRLILELGEKMAALPSEAQPSPRVGIDRAQEDAVEALVGLGYPRQTAEKALDKAREAGETSLEGLVRAALRSLAPRR